jgi:hypothetical protein
VISRCQTREIVRSLLNSRLFWIWVAVWIATRALIVVQVGFWNHVAGVEFQDVNTFQSWSNSLAAHQMPSDEGWQYPPGAAFVMLLPRLASASYGHSFVVAMLLFDLAGLVLIGVLAKREHRDAGVWVWLLAMPVLGPLSVLRFDLVPTVLAIAALIVIHRRPGWFGALVGIGASVKVWPIALLFAEWSRRRLAVAAGVALGVIALTFLVAGIAFGGQSTFFDNQDTRGIEAEAIAATPWYVRSTVTGQAVPTRPQHGSIEVVSPAAETASVVLKWLALGVLLAAALWWLARERAIRRGRTDLEAAEISRDFAFALVLLLTVVSRVLSPQYMIWLIGVSAVALSAGTRRIARPAWVVVGAVILSDSLYVAPANVAIRNLALLAASIDAALAMLLILRGTADTLAGNGRADHVGAGGRPPERQLGSA